MSVEIVLDPQETPAVVIATPSAPSVTVTTPGVVVVTETDRVTISDNYILTIGA